MQSVIHLACMQTLIFLHHRHTTQLHPLLVVLVVMSSLKVVLMQQPRARNKYSSIISQSWNLWRQICPIQKKKIVVEQNVSVVSRIVAQFVSRTHMVSWKHANAETLHVIFVHIPLASQERILLQASRFLALQLHLCLQFFVPVSVLENNRFISHRVWWHTIFDS